MSKYNFIANPAFTSLLSEISKNAKKGRIFEADEEEKKKDDETDPAAPEEQPAPEAPAPDAAAEPAPTEEPSATPEVAPESPVETSDEAGNEADLAQAELEKAKAKKLSAEEELEEQRYIKLLSPSGVTALLQLVLDPAIKTNQIDGLARNLVGKLAIETEEDFKAFKDDTIEFRGIVGFPQLVESMAPFVGGPEAALQPTEEPAL